MAKKVDGVLVKILAGIVLALLSGLFWHFQYNKVDKDVYEVEKAGVQYQLQNLQTGQIGMKKQQELNTRLLLRIDAKLENE